MSPRERNLAIAVAALAVVVCGYFLFTWWDGKVSARRVAIEALQARLDEQQDALARGERAFQQIKELRRRSLPSDINVARSRYRDWLLELADKRVNLSQPIVTPGSITPVVVDNQVAFRRLSFSVRGQGTLEQLTDLLFAFYATDLAHRVRMMDVKPIRDSRQLDISLEIEALTVEGPAPIETLEPVQIASMDQQRRDAYKGTILGRNLFAPANRPPQIGRVSPQRITTRDTLSLDLRATDPDLLDAVTFRLADGAPRGATIDRSGKLRFRPPAKGSYQITVIACDDGVPPASSRETISVTVSEPPPQVARTEPRPPPPPARAYFEDGQFAFVTAITEIDGRRQLWLNDRATGETSKLHEGDAFQIKRLKAVVSRIGPKQVELTSLDERRRYELGENLAQGQKLSPSASDDGE